MLRSPHPSSQDARDFRSGGPTGFGNCLVFEVCCGRTEHPLRPVNSSRFLIGSSSRCDLCLGSADVPPLHTMIFVDGSDIWLEAMAPSPVVQVNGRPETSVRLADGDHIRIGQFELVAHVPAAPSVVDPALEDAVAREDADLAESELSAAELVERIEAATELVNHFEQRQRLGLEALWNAVAGHQQPLAPAADINNDSVLPIHGGTQEIEGRAPADLEALVVQLSGVVAELEKRSGVQWRREAGYLDAVSALFETQDRLSRQVEILLHRVASLNSERTGREPGRAIA